MAKRAKHDRKSDATDPGGAFAANPFADLNLGDLPAGPADPEPAAEAAAGAGYRGATARLRIEKKGRAGKTVTVLELEGLELDQVAKLASQLRKRLGVGGAVEGLTVDLQGDQRPAAAAYLRELGLRVKGA